MEAGLSFWRNRRLWGSAVGVMGVGNSRMKWSRWWLLFFLCLYLIVRLLVRVIKKTLGYFELVCLGELFTVGALFRALG